MAETAWWQEHEGVDHIVFTVSEPGEMDEGSQLSFSFLFRPILQPME